ncbi:MAG: stage II sporulation protein M [Acidobacteria bacterium]|nr:stage II sporulation protein M [Acidobacteriota bacterium]
MPLPRTRVLRSPTGWFSLRRLIVMNGAVVVFSAMTGAVVAQAGSAAWAAPPASSFADGDAGRLGHDWWRIFSGNGSLAAAMVVGGALSLGAFSVVHLCWNGYILGYGLTSILHQSPEAIARLATYVPIEFLAFVLATAASQRLAALLVCASARRGPRRLAPVAAVLGTSLVLLAVAALVEADVARTLRALRTTLTEGA